MSNVTLNARLYEDAGLGAAARVLLPYMASRAGVLGSGMGGGVSAVAAPLPVNGPGDASAPALEPPNPEHFNSTAPLGAAENPLAVLMGSLAVRRDQIYKMIEKAFEAIIQFMHAGMEHARGEQQRQAERTKEAQQKVLDQAGKDAASGLLGKIFGWIGKVFAMIMLAISSVALCASGQVGLAVVTIVALVLTVMDFASAISQEAGGPDIGLAGLVAMAAEAGGLDESTADAIRQWLGLGLQIATAIMGAAGGIGATQAITDATVKGLNAVLTGLSGLTSLANGATGTISAVKRMEMAEADAELYQLQAFQQIVLTQSTKRWAEDVQKFQQELDEHMSQRSEALSNERSVNMSISAV